MQPLTLLSRSGNPFWVASERAIENQLPSIQLEMSPDQNILNVIYIRNDSSDSLRRTTCRTMKFFLLLSLCCAITSAVISLHTLYKRFFSYLYRELIKSNFETTQAISDTPA